MKIAFTAVSLMALAALFGCSTLSPSTPTRNQAVLGMDYRVDLLKLDGASKTVSNLGWGGRNRGVIVEPGSHEVTVRYSTIFDDGDNHEVFKSEPVTLTFTAQGGDRFRVVYDAPEVKDDVDAMDRNVDLRIVRLDQRESDAQPAPGPAAADATATDSDRLPAPDIAAPKALPLLKHWWDKATPEERDAFRDMIRKK